MLSDLLNLLRSKSIPYPFPKYRAHLLVESLEDRIALSHTPLGPAFEVNVNPVNVLDESVPAAIANDADGDFVVIWSTNGQKGTDIFARLFNNDGTARTGEIQVNDAPLVEPIEQTIDVAMDADGDFVVVYDALDRNMNQTIYAQQFDAVGNKQGTTFTVSPGGGEDVAMDDAGNFVVVYDRGGSIFFQQFDANGQVTIPATQVSTLATEPLFSPPDVDSDSNGNFVIVWNHPGTLGGNQLVSQRYSNAGVATGGLIQVNPPSATFFAGKVSVAVAENGSGFAVSWTNSGGPRIESRIFDANGAPAGPVFQVNTTTLSLASQAEIATNNDGDFVVAWTSFDNGGFIQIFARTFNRDGTPDSPELLVQTSKDSLSPAVVDMDRRGDFVVGWTKINITGGEVGGPVEADVFARIYERSEPQEPPDQPPDFPPGGPGNPDDPNNDGGDSEEPVPSNPPTSLPPVQSPPSTRFDPAVVISLAQSILLEDETLFPLEPPPFLGFPPLSPLFESPLELEANGGIDFLVGGSSPVGEISGVIFADINGNGVKDENEAGIAHQLVFLDLNKNGIRDTDEPTLQTNEKGEYVFEKLTMDDYLVSQDLSSLRFQQTLPASNQPHKVPLRVDNPQEANVNFGSMDRLNDTQPASSPTVPPPPKSEVNPPPKDQNQQ